MEIVLDYWEQRLIYHALLRWYRQEIETDPENIDLIMDLKKLIRQFGPDPDEVIKPEDHDEVEEVFGESESIDDPPPYVEPGTWIPEVDE